MNNFNFPFFRPPNPFYYNNYNPININNSLKQRYHHDDHSPSTYSSSIKDNRTMSENQFIDALDSEISHSKRSDNNEKQTKSNSQKSPLLEIGNLKFFGDDILILAVIYFLYTQHTDDKLLLIALFSLLF